MFIFIWPMVVAVALTAAPGDQDAIRPVAGLHERQEVVAREAAVAREGRRLVGERPLNEVADIGEIVELRKQAREQRRLHFIQ
jgi:hypothetical protein